MIKKIKGNYIVVLLSVTMIATLSNTLMAQELRGEVGSAVSSNWANDGNFDSELNPSNQFEVTDLSILNRANLRFEGSNDVAALDFRIDFQSYPIGDVLLGMASIVAPDTGYSAYGLTPTEQALAVADLALLSGDTIWSANLTRANLAWFPNDWFQLVLGRQKFNMGYGYGWNPMDFVNFPKNTSDPEAFIAGIDALNLGFIPSDWLEIYTYAVIPLGTGDYEDLMAGIDMTMYLEALEIKLSGFYGGLERSSDQYDDYPSGGGLGLFLDVLDLGVYGEASLRTRSRRNSIDSAGSISLDEDLQFSALAGIEYVFESGVSLVMEYFYNQEGWNDDERKNYRDTLSGLSSLTYDYYRLYTPAYFSEHYGLINLSIPLYDLGSTLSTGIIMSIETGAFTVTPKFSTNLDSFGNLVSEISYLGSFNFYGDQYSEAYIFPINHVIQFELSYSF